MRFLSIRRLSLNRIRHQVAIKSAFVEQIEAAAKSSEKVFKNEFEFEPEMQIRPILDLPHQMEEYTKNGKALTPFF